MSADLDALSAVALPQPGSAGPRSFGATKALISFVLVFVGQAVAGFGVMFFAVLIALAKGQNAGDPSFATGLTSQITVPLLVSACVVSAVVMFAVARLWAWDVIFDTSNDGIGLTPATRVQVLSWSLAGLFLGATYLTVAQWLVPFNPSTPMGPLATAAAAGGINRIAWAVLALAYAPLVEEFFFRGLLLRGFRTSWGVSVAGLTVTILFVLMHLFETVNYWPATVAVLSLSGATLAARLVTKSIYPAAALHGAYNFALVVYVFAGQGIT